MLWFKSWRAVFSSSKVFSYEIFIYFVLISDIRSWISSIEQHSKDNIINKILVGNKSDMDESKRVCKH
jgi:hypothetical protein